MNGINSSSQFRTHPVLLQGDQEGNRFPIIDKLQMSQVGRCNSIVLMGYWPGEIDFTIAIYNVTNNRFFSIIRKKVNFRFIDVALLIEHRIIQMICNYEDDGFRELFQNRISRVAMYLHRPSGSLDVPMRSR